MKITSTENNIRINKLLADNNICSRREADKLIESGKVFINKRIAKLGQLIMLNDIIEIKDNNKDELVYYLYNKSNTQTLTGNEIDGYNNLSIINNLNKNFSGLVLMTNDMSLIKYLQKNKIPNTYSIYTKEKIRSGIERLLQNPLDIDGKIYNDIKNANINDNNLHLLINENSSTHIAKILNALNLTIDKLERKSISIWNNKSMKYSEYKRIDNKDIQILLSK